MSWLERLMLWTDFGHDLQLHTPTCLLIAYVFLSVLILDAVFAVNDVIDVRPVFLTHLVFSLCLGRCVYCE